MKLQRLFSSAAQQAPILKPKQRAPLELPVLHQNFDLLINQVIKLPEKGLAGKLSQLVGGAPKGFFDSKRMAPAGILMRNEYSNYWSKLHKQNLDVMIDGPEGCGKSTLLMLMASAWGDVLKRPTVLFTNMNRWANGYYPYLKNEALNLYEQKELMIDLIRDIAVVNPELKFEGRGLGEWHEEWKLGHAVMDTQTFIKVLGAMPEDTLFALDGINALYTPATQYHHPDGSPIPGQQLSIFRLIHDVLHLQTPKQRPKWRVVGVSSRTDPLHKCELPEFCKRHQLSEYSVHETEMVLEHYAKSGFIPDKGNAKMQRLVSGGNAIQLLKTSTYHNLLY